MLDLARNCIAPIDRQRMTIECAVRTGLASEHRRIHSPTAHGAGGSHIADQITIDHRPKRDRRLARHWSVTQARFVLAIHPVRRKLFASSLDIDGTDSDPADR